MKSLKKYIAGGIILPVTLLLSSDYEILKEKIDETIYALNTRNCEVVSENSNVLMKIVFASNVIRENFYKKYIEGKNFTQEECDEMMETLDEYTCEYLKTVLQSKILDYEIIDIKKGIPEKTEEHLKKYHKELCLPPIEDSVTVKMNVKYEYNGTVYERELEWYPIKVNGEWIPLGM